mmetsp:Transcript_25440/g.38270  ORF Transcript_25440/g.38270 Transcript_25440/m.38270 type:complete len:104 (+) Transcript_25440:995-1306(+)
MISAACHTAKKTLVALAEGTAMEKVLLFLGKTGYSAVGRHATSGPKLFRTAHTESPEPRHLYHHPWGPASSSLAASGHPFVKKPLIVKAAVKTTMMDDDTLLV